MLEELQKLEYGWLHDKIGIQVYEYIPDDENGIYCVIGDVESVDYSTKTFDGYEVTSTIYIYAYSESMLKVKRELHNIANAIKGKRETANGFLFEYHKVQTISAKRIDWDLIEGFIQIVYRTEEE